ncbi:hypothetical protein PV05_06698 [Exophiala xenobiotica]|uniref:Uncharacterized protein n=1 Tax=Exophiala xenobiotica TaxID=348802 RepID=A0A0D2F327_9EURO|nr:uncharacterized protein PV05_06698 [Exophiala xenobiotica]KIW54334.1 hypothetical protein PV05_06698 [Exophiala xenobiotica]
MGATGQQPSSRYALVSSLYGPGTIACWYLTILSVLVCWTLHPRKRKSGSIDVDLIAILTLPTVAVGHLISQVLRLMHSHANALGFDTDDNQFVQDIAAIEAPFSIIESFMAISVILFLIAVRSQCLRRAISVALAGLVCLAAECYIHFSSFEELGIRYEPSKAKSDDEPAFSRSFVADFTGLIIAIMIILAVCSVTASAVVILMLRSPRAPEANGGEAEQGTLSENREAPQEAVEAYPSVTEETLPSALAEGSRRTPLAEMERLREQQDRTYEKWTREKRASAWISMAFLPATFLLSVLPSADSFHFAYQALGVTGSTTTIWLRLKIFAGHFYPHSANSFADLDQALATAAGATVLGFSIYSVAKARYELQSGKHATRVEQRRTELARLGRDLTVSSLDDRNGPPAQDERNEAPQ